KHEFIGGFAAVMPNGNSGMFKREGRAAFQPPPPPPPRLKFDFCGVLEF
ncbi:putative minor tail protein Z, partial [Wolbachia endosymbiont of Culex quinquefasciatus JHB]